MHYRPQDEPTSQCEIGKVEPTSYKPNIGEFHLGKLAISQIFRLWRVSSGL